MKDSPTTVLLIEDDSADARLIQDALAGTGNNLFHVEWVSRLADALERLGSERFEVVLLDLSLPDSQGLEAFDQVFQAAPDSLILVLSGLTDEETALQAMQRGAHDYFSKGHVDAHWLPRALRYVIDRKTAQGALQSSEERFRAMSDASPLGIFVSDAEGSCIYTNAAYHTISGLTLEQTLGTNWSMAIHPEDRERVLADWRNAARGQVPFQTEFRFLQEDKSIVWTRVNSAAMLDGKKWFGLVQTVEDITGRKSAEFVLK
ncbi:MAG: PAS domain S-box protein, partial [Gammaproteobacteria bacterium]|nr:PAS domain S-box protein [Gammaproteobacteria bacterium]